MDNTEEFVTVEHDNKEQNQQKTITMGVDEFKSYIDSAVKAGIDTIKQDYNRLKVEEYNKKISEAVENSQASILSSSVKTNDVNIANYVNKVIEEDLTSRLSSYDGTKYYPNTEEGLIKQKILILEKMGLTRDEISKEMAEIILKGVPRL